MSDWYAHARHVNVGPGAGSMVGGPARATHHTTEGGSVDGAIATYRKTGNYPTFTIDYAADDVVQHLPVTTAATALKHPAPPHTNRMGTVNVQVEWVGQAAHPFTAGHEAGPNVAGFFDYLRELGIPDSWPAGSPLPYPDSYGDNGQRDAETWSTKAGHYGHSQVPGNEHGDPGAIDPAFVRQTAKHPAPATTPAPAPAPLEEDDDMAQVITADGKALYIATARHGARHIASMVELHGMVAAGVLTAEQAKPRTVSADQLQALVAAAA